MTWRPPLDPATPVNRAVVALLFIVDYWERYGWGPSVREVADAADVNLSTGHALLRKLQRGGWVTWEPGRARTLRPTVQRVPARQETSAVL